MRTRLTLLTLSLVVLGWAPFHVFPIFRTDSPADSTVAALSTLPISPATAAAVRSCDLDTARRDLEPTTALDTREGAAARVLLGLYAHACEDHVVATYLLAANEDPFGVLEDLRLWALGGSATTLEDLEVANESYNQLISDHPASWLAPHARVAAATLARDQDDSARVFALAYQARLAGGQTEADEALERLTWDLAAEVGDRQELFVSARQLLARFPGAADELNVASRFQNAHGVVEWDKLLTPSQLMRRSHALLDAGDPVGALNALAAVPATTRGHEWSILQARALTADHRGQSALELLQPVEANELQPQIELARARANAALDAATVRRGRHNLSFDEREEMRETAHQELWRIYRLDDGTEYSVRALRTLYKGLAGDSDDEARRVLELLKRLEPDDTTGANDLWRAGWASYLDENLGEAAETFADLSYLYPSSRADRQATYWRARSLERLGEAVEAQSLYRNLLAADTRDFYSRFAEPRLSAGSPPVAGTPGSQPEAWPSDPVLDRARLLTDAGLDLLAEGEIDALEEQADRAAAAGLKSLALARQGRRRDSISILRRVFPALGSPHQAGVPKDALHLYYPLDFYETIDELAAQQNLPAEILLAMVRQESAFDPQARSWAGARGLMQIMPATAREIAQRIGLTYSTARLTDPAFSLRLGSTYFKQVLRIFDENVELALAGYNAGPNRIKRLLRNAGTDVDLDLFLEDLSYEEPRTYVKRILLFSDSYRQLYPVIGEPATGTSPQS